jgi:hypothetical protein
MKININSFRLLVVSGLIFAILVTWQAKAQAGISRVYLPILHDRFDIGPGDVKGEVIDAVGGSPIAGARVCFEENCVQTNDKGLYKLSGIPAGGQYFSASADTYYSIGRWVNIIAQQEAQLNLVLSKILHFSDVQMRIVTTWSTNLCWPASANPPCVAPAYENDLDAFLWVTTTGSEPRLIWDATPNVSIQQCTSYPYACKENDAREGTGPETIAVQHFTPGANYYFGVLNYNQYQPPVPSMRETQASVGVYSEQGLINTFNVPSTGVGNFWYVFSIDDSGNIHPQNCIIELSPFDGILPDCNLQPVQKMQNLPRKP